MAQIPIDIVNSIRNFRSKIENDLEIEKIILFGSFAKGNPSKNSDVDICIIAKNVSNNYSALLKIAPKVIGIDLRIEPLVYDIKDYNEKELFGVLKEIKEHGIEIN